MIQQLVTLKVLMMRLLFAYPQLLNCTRFELYTRIRNTNMTDWSISDPYHKILRYWDRNGPVEQINNIFYGFSFIHNLVIQRGIDVV